MTPKSLLRHKMSVSPLSRISDGGFELIIPDESDVDRATVERVVFCSGKVYFDLQEARQVHDAHGVALAPIASTWPPP